MEHELDKCPVKEENWEKVWAGAEEVKKRGSGGRKLERYSGCFQCGIRQKWWES